MDILSVFAVIASIVFIGFLAEVIFRKLNIPDVLLLIGVGIAMGSIFNWVDINKLEGTELFTTFALIFILFQGALNIEFKSLVRSLSSTLKITLFNFVLTVLAVAGISYLLGYDLLVSLLIGTILGGSSSAIVIPMVQNIEIQHKYGVLLTLESAITDVLCILGSITILEIIETGQAIPSLVFREVFSSFSLAIVTGLIVGFIWIFLLRKNETLVTSYMLTVALVIGLYAFVESPFIEASGPIAALAFGLVLGNSRSIFALKDAEDELEINEKKKKGEPVKLRTILSPSARNFYEEISFFVKTFFFVYLGLLIDFSSPQIFLYGAVLTLGIYVIRAFSVSFIFRKDELESNEKAFLEVLIPKGLAAAVLAGIAVQSGIFGVAAGVFVNTILSVVLLSIFLTSVLVFLTEEGWYKGMFSFMKKKG